MTEETIRKIVIAVWEAQHASLIAEVERTAKGAAQSAIMDYSTGLLRNEVRRKVEAAMENLRVTVSIEFRDKP